jgi:hypothetical protein
MASASSQSMAAIAYQGLGPAAALADRSPRPTRRGVLHALGQVWCGWSRGGHEMIIRTEGTRMYLECRNCLRETPGWSTSEDALGRHVMRPHPR